MPQAYKDRIEFYEPRTLEEAIRKANYCYDKIKGKPDYHKAWKDKKNEKFYQRRKGFKPSGFRKQQKQPSQAVSKLVGVTGGKPKDPPHNKGPLKCRKCEGPHLRRYCPLENENARPTYNVQEAEIVGQVARSFPRIYAALEDCQEDHESTVVDVAGNIVKQSLYILIDPGSMHNYINPRVVEICAFKKVKHRKSWLV